MNFPTLCTHPSFINEADTYELASDARKEITENNNVFGSARSAGRRNNFWSAGQTLRIAIFSSNQEATQVVIAAINQWAPHVNLTFKFVEDPGADIRIVVSGQAKDGNWSAIGNDALRISPGEPTMMLGTDYKSPDFTHIVLHEFGHALGLKHEHQHPDAGLDWNLPVVYREYRNLGYSNETIYLDVLKKLDRAEVRLTPYDRQSIMHYAFPAYITWNKNRSPAKQNNLHKSY